MKKKLLAVLAVFLLGVLTLIIGISGDDPLDPAVDEALYPHFPDVPPDQNAHIGVSGLGNSQYGDVVTAGLKYLKDGYQGQNDSQREAEFDFSYKNPCVFTRQNEDCLDQIVDDASIIDQAVQKNKEILERYRSVQKMPLFVNSSGFSDPVPRYSPVLDASRLLGAKALLDIKRGDVGAGLEFIEADLDFYMMMGQSDYVSLIDLMIAVGGLKNNLIAISKIVEDDQIDLTGQETRLRKMLHLDFNANQMMAKALMMEKRQFLPSLLQLNEEAFQDSTDLKHKLMVYFLFKKNMTINRITARTDEVIENIKSAPLLGYPEANQRLEAWHEKMTNYTEPDFESLYNYYGIFFSRTISVKPSSISLSQCI